MKKLVLFFMMGITLNAFARQQRVVIPMNNDLYSGISTVFLKRQLQRTRPELNFQNVDLINVVVFAKSARDRASAYLSVGNINSRVKTIDGSFREFNRPGNFNRLVLRAPFNGQGQWKLHLRGRIRLNRIVLNFNNISRPGEGLISRRCGYVLETIWGQDIRKFFETALGRRGPGTMSSTCRIAQNRCRLRQQESFLTKCTRLSLR